MYASSPKYGIFGQWLFEVNTLEMKSFHTYLIFIRKSFNNNQTFTVGLPVSVQNFEFHSKMNRLSTEMTVTKM